MRFKINNTKLAIQPAPNVIAKNKLTISGRHQSIAAIQTGRQEKQSKGFNL
jgi:hypothetical protein